VLSVTIPVSEASRRRKIEVVAGHRQEAVEAPAGQESAGQEPARQQKSGS
jgi:HSP20 family protein